MSTVIAAAPSARLRSVVLLTLHTGFAKALIRGRRTSPGKPAIIGLFGFAARLRGIWRAARADDPYADLWLIRLDEALRRARYKLDNDFAALDERMCVSPAIDFGTAWSDAPFHLTLKFSNPYAYQAAVLVGEFDRNVCMLLTAKHVGVVTERIAERILHDLSATLRRLFTTPQGYRCLGIDRDALRSDPTLAERAEGLMGTLPPAILAGERRPELAPGPRSDKQRAHSGKVDVQDS
jgi:integrating conjugative element protein (TIGR03761 family)